jgi:hypothetical protein
MDALLAGFVAGAVAGIVMGLISHLLFRAGIFGSSLFVIDGSFLFRLAGHKARPSLIAGAGFFMHLMTSGVFGALYFLIRALLKIDYGSATSFPLVALYVALLYLSMLLVALPVAGEGLLGRNSGPLSWLEQLILHGIFAVVFYGCITIFL